jgi:hypothetical protein
VGRILELAKTKGSEQAALTAWSWHIRLSGELLISKVGLAFLIIEKLLVACFHEYEVESRNPVRLRPKVESTRFPVRSCPKVESTKNPVQLRPTESAESYPPSVVQKH